MVTLTVLMGPPGAGKTTWLAAHSAGQVVCSTERLRLNPAMRTRQGALLAYLKALRGKAERALRAGQGVVIDGCNTRTSDRSTWLGIARKVPGCEAHLVVFHTPLAELLRVQVDRGDSGVPAHKLHQYHEEYGRALPLIAREGWTHITHVQRNSLQPKKVSKW